MNFMCQSASIAWLSWRLKASKRFFLATVLIGVALQSGLADCVLPGPGLVGWWRAEGNGVDVTGSHYGAFPYGIGFAGGKVGQAFDFDSSFRRLSIPDSPAFQLTNAMTLEGWVYIRQYGGFICFRGDNRGGLDNWVLDTYQSGFVNFQIDDESNNYTSVRAPLSLNQWHHVAGTWDRAGGDMKIYMDGVLVMQTNTSLVPIGVLDPGSEPAIGIGNHGGTYHQFPLNGLVDDFAIYNRALSATEIQNIFNAGSAGKCLPPPPPPTCAPAPAGLVGWWNGEGNANDKAGTNNGVLEGTLGFASGKVGQAFSFGNVIADLRVPASPALNVGSGSGFTVDAWINPSDVSQLHPIVEWNDGAGSWGVHFYISTDAGPGSFYANITDSGGGWHQMHSLIASLVTNTFQHVALTYDTASGLATIYCNGLVVAQQNLGSFTPLTTYDVYFGRRPPGGADAYTFEGSIDEASIFNRALTASEIQSIYNAGSAGKCEQVIVPPPPSCSPPSAGMVGWWRAENNGSDAATNNSGTMANGLSFAPGKVGQAFSFDGENDHFDIPASASLNVGSADGMTFETWVKPSTINMQVVAEWNNGAGGVGSHMWLSVDHTVAGDGVGNIVVNLYDTTETSHGILAPAGVMVANEWQHIALTYDKTSGVAKIYRNGAQVATQNVGAFTPQTSYDLHLGYRASSAFQGTYFRGLMDEPSLYNRALSAVEIQNIYKSSSAGKCVPPPSSSLFIAGPITNAANGHAYYLLSPTNWPAAEAIAVSLGGHLATINNAAETLWVYNTFGSYGGGDYTMWIGLTDEVNEGEWHWTSGWGGTYRNWSPGQPDNYGGAEDHVWMWSPASGQPAGSWNDGPGSFIEPAVIEIGEDAPIPVILAGPITNSANGHAYYLLSPTNWHAAEDIAVSLGGHLATINDADENTWIFDTFASYGGDDYRLWIGYTDETSEGQWRWQNGWRGTYSNWYPGEPNNWDNNEHYAWIWNLGSGGGGTWADAGADLLEAAVVEIGVDPALCTPPPGDLVGLWRAEGNANDSFALNNGFVVNGTSFATGMVSQAFSFDGVNDSVTIPQTPQLNPGNQVTIEFWMKADPTNAMNSYQGLVTSDFFGIEIANGFALGPVGVSFFISTDGGASVSPSSYPDTATDNGGGAVVSAGVWHHVAGTYDGANLQLYIDGQPWGVPAHASGPISPMLANSSVSIGGEDGRTICPDCIGSRYFNGLIDDVAIYKRALSATEIHDIYVAAEGGKCTPPPLEQLIIAGPITNSANGHWYYLTTEMLWQDAENVGERLGGHLTTINDDDENNWVFNTFSSWGETDRELWIGLTDESFEGYWRWSSGSTTQYRHWLEGQPDNYGGWEGAPGEDYAHFWMPNVGAPPGTWNDAPGYLSHYGVIEVGNDPPPTPNTNCIAPPDGLVAWWRADGNAADIAGGNNGAIHSGVEFTSGKINQSFIFDGIGSYVEVPHSPALVLMGELTIEFWVKRQEPFGSDYIINKGGDWTGGVLNYGVAIAPPEYGNILHFTFAGGNRGTIGIADLNWHHCAVVARNGDSSVSFYIDGVPHPTTHFEGAETVNLYPSTQPLYIGAQLDPIANYFSKTLIDELGIYSRALSAGEIALIYDASIAGKCADALLPVAMPDAFSTATNTPVSISARKLLLNDFDPNGLALSVAGVSSNSALGGTVELISGRIHYTPPADFEGNDQFNYSITNEQGRAASGNVTATVGRGGPVGLNITYGPVMDDGQFVVRFAGIPGLTYTIEAAPSLEGAWTKVGNFTAPTTDAGFGIGAFEFREPITGDEARYYRTVYPSY